MDLSELKRKLLQHGSIDVDSLYAQYREQGGSEDINDFVRYLRDQGVIDARILADLHKAHPLEATFIMADGPPPVPPEEPAAAEPAAAAVEHDDDDEEPPRYEMMGLLGKGAMGEVHVAKDVVLRRTVAFKSILPAMSQNQQVVDRFIGEMQITSQLDHPFIVPVYGLEVTPEGSVAYAMKLVKGKELADLLEEAKNTIAANGRLDEDHTLEGRLDFFLKVCDAIAFAHEKKIVHRDLKPANIMIGEHKEVYVMDWGIARPMGASGAAADAGLDLYEGADDGTDTERTRLGQALGTPIYMSPEQAAGKNNELDGRSDLYTLGLILQETMTLERAVGGTTLAEVITNAKMGKRVAPRPIEMSAVTAHELVAIIEKATQLEPKNRYATVTDFANDIRRYLRNEEVSVLPDNAVRKLGRWISHHRMASLALMLTLLLVGAGAALGLLAHNRAQAAERHTHELRLSELQTESALKAHAVDQKLQRYESGLAQLVGATQLVIDNATASQRHAYIEPEFLEEGRVPDLVASKYYKKEISTASAVFLLAPGAARATAAPLMGALPVLEPTFAEVVVDSAGLPTQKLSAGERRELISGRGSPVHRVFLSLQSGVHMSFPGMAGFAKDFDARTDPTYLAVVDAHEIHWSKPREDKSLGGMVMTATAPLYDLSGRFRGSAGLEVSIDRLGEEIGLDLGYVEFSALVTRDGKLLTGASEDIERRLKEVLALPTVSAAMKEGSGGHASAILGGRDVIVTYYPLHSVEWYLVTVANVTTMLGSEPKKDKATPWASAAPPPVVKTSKPAPAPPPPPPVEEPDAGAGGEDADAGAGGEAPTEQPQPRPPSGAPWPAERPSATPPQPPAAKSAIPKNPFDKWDVYKKGKGKKAP